MKEFIEDTDRRIQRLVDMLVKDENISDKKAYQISAKLNDLKLLKEIYLKIEKQHNNQIKPQIKELEY